MFRIINCAKMWQFRISHSFRPYSHINRRNTIPPMSSSVSTTLDEIAKDSEHGLGAVKAADDAYAVASEVCQSTAAALGKRIWAVAEGAMEKYAREKCGVDLDSKQCTPFQFCETLLPKNFPKGDSEGDVWSMDCFCSMTMQCRTGDYDMIGFVPVGVGTYEIYMKRVDQMVAKLDAMPALSEAELGQHLEAIKDARKQPWDWRK